jgi:hypothetical protein
MKNNGEAENDAPLTPGHEQLWQIAIKLPTDFEPYGAEEARCCW